MRLFINVRSIKQFRGSLNLIQINHNSQIRKISVLSPNPARRPPVSQIQADHPIPRGRRQSSSFRTLTLTSASSEAGRRTTTTADARRRRRRRRGKQVRGIPIKGPYYRRRWKEDYTRVQARERKVPRRRQLGSDYSAQNK